MISRWRIITLSSLCIISTIACGFSAWVSNPYSDVSIDVEVGEVIEQGKKLSDLGFSANSVVSNISSMIINETEPDFGKQCYLDAEVTIDKNILKEISTNDDLFIKIEFTYTNATSSHSASLPTINSLSIFPKTFPSHAFSGYRSSSSTKLNTVFSFPLKSSTEMNFYDLAVYDSTYPVINSGIYNYAVPITLRFFLTDVPSTIVSSSFKYVINYSLTTGGAIV
ncbi:MAG: hypothetical protein PUE07_00360 [bacterium]|nr:hypothetical protein [bacterium]